MAGFNLDSVSNSIAPKVQAEESKLTSMLQNTDVSDPASMIKLQMEYSKYNMEVGLMSSLAKDVKDSVNQVIQRM